MFSLADMPMPPSSNHQYMVRASFDKVLKRPKGWLAPTKDLETFEKDFESWRKQNLVAVELARKFILDKCLMKGGMVRADWYFCFPHSKMWTLDGRAKKLDTKNRVKAIQDCLADAIRVDDSHFWCGYDEKQETEKNPRVYVVLKPFKPRSVRDMKKEDL